jgi:CheY-like chemotaxis protein
MQKSYKTAIGSLDYSTISFLIVDDQPFTRRIVRSILAGFGSREIYESANGEEALELASNVAPSIIVTDLVMPASNGMSLVTKLKAPESPARKIPIIVSDENRGAFHDQLRSRRSSGQAGIAQGAARTHHPDHPPQGKRKRIHPAGAKASPAYRSRAKKSRRRRGFSLETRRPDKPVKMQPPSLQVARVRRVRADAPACVRE